MKSKLFRFPCLPTASSMFLFGALALAGCGGERDYAVAIDFDPETLANRINHLEVSLVSACFNEASLGQEPLETIHSVTLERGQAPGGFGDIEDGEYSLYVRGFGPCVAAAACDTIDIAEGGESVFPITLNEITLSKYDPAFVDNGGCGEATCVENGTERRCECPEGFEYSNGECNPPEGEHEDYLSHWVWLIQNANIEPERNKSVNADIHDDGLALRIRGTTYEKGIGVQAPTELGFNLDGRCTRFRSLVGIDDEVQGLGEAKAEVWVDNVREYESGTLTGTSPPEEIDIDVRGASVLRLVTDALSDSTNDHVDWINARVVCDEDWHGDAVNSFASDWVWEGTSNELGPVERDQSNGGEDEDDGDVITINGEEFSKGIGSHAPSEVELDLAGYCRRFYADIGIDDEIPSGGSVVFEVWGDDEMLYQSGTIRSTSDIQAVNVDLADVNRLRLVITDAGDGTTGDVADWANARLLCRSGWQGEPVDTHVSDWIFRVAYNNYGVVERDQSNGGEHQYDGAPIQMNGMIYERGLGVHAQSFIALYVNQQCTRFHGFVGIDDDSAAGGSTADVLFQLTADGGAIYTAPVMHYGDEPHEINVDITGVTELRLDATVNGDDGAWDHADWGYPMLTCDIGAMGIVPP